MNKNKGSLNLGLIVLISVMVLVSILTIVIKPKTYNGSGSGSTGGSSSLNSYLNNSSKTVDTSYLSITDVKVTSNSSYTICTGKINVRSTSPNKYRFIKVKGAFKDKSGKTVDTDSTYAIGSEWLEPGESSSFRMSVKKDYSIKSCTVTIMK